MIQGHGLRAAVAVLVAAIATLAFGAAGATAKTKWLCLPGAKSNPCTPSLTTARISPSGEVLGRADVKRAKRPQLDCFYVYPTVSDQETPVATRRIDPEERSIALYQAARFSQRCRVYAPMYRQITLRGLLSPDKVTPAGRAAGYSDVRAAWRDYLARYNKGRGVVLIGHSQGTFVLRQLVTKEIDTKPAVRRRLVSALLLGGNVLVKAGGDDGGDFKHVRACRSPKQIGCVVAYSIFNDSPPADALFGRTATEGQQVLCTNPAALAGGSAPLDTIYPTEPFAPGTTFGILAASLGLPAPKTKAAWYETRGAYSGACSSEGGANVLLVKAAEGAPVLNATPDARWGLHVFDSNLPLGDLVRLVGTQGAAYARARSR